MIGLMKDIQEGDEKCFFFLEGCSGFVLFFFFLKKRCVSVSLQGFGFIFRCVFITSVCDFFLFLVGSGVSF